MFNLTIEGHAEAVAYMKSFNIPMIVTGGVHLGKQKSWQPICLFKPSVQPPFLGWHGSYKCHGRMQLMGPPLLQGGATQRPMWQGAGALKQPSW